MLFFLYAKIKRCASGGLHTYVVPFYNNFHTGHMPGFFILGRKIMKEQERNQIKTNDIHQTKADLYESLYDAE